jgi:hypothetical protein
MPILAVAAPLALTWETVPLARWARCIRRSWEMRELPANAPTIAERATRPCPDRRGGKRGKMRESGRTFAATEPRLVARRRDGHRP